VISQAPISWKKRLTFQLIFLDPSSWTPAATIDPYGMLSIAASNGSDDSKVSKAFSRMIFLVCGLITTMLIPRVPPLMFLFTLLSLPFTLILAKFPALIPAECTDIERPLKALLDLLLTGDPRLVLTKHT